ncbi:MAG: GNAT family N-acetyltransferase [Lachnospiraceae bacterium]|nr:GNAT family N-acetyltransferase [Lachnospiraceae bacterium]
MNSVSSKEHAARFRRYAAENGFPEACFLSEDNVDSYIGTAVDAYREYPLFLSLFNGRYNEKSFTRMLSVDLKSRLNHMLGIASSDAYESVMLIEPPMMKQIGMLQYVKSADAGAYLLLLCPAMYRLETYERFARKKREKWVTESTWYIYIFATRNRFQRKGFGRRLMQLMISYVQQHGGRICLETDLPKNVAMYERFGFQTVDQSEYMGKLKHYVMILDGGSR